MKQTRQNCPKCGHVMSKDGRTPNGRQRYECPDCGVKTSTPPPVTIAHLGEHLRTVRETAKLTQTAVSEQLNHDRAWLSRIESGDRGILVSDLFELAKIYNVRASEILAGYERVVSGKNG